MKEAAETLVPKSRASCGSIGSTQRSEIPELNAASARSTMAPRDFASLGPKPLYLPATAALYIEQPVVQAIRAALPELDLARQDAIAAPVRWPRRRIAIALARLFHRPLECSTVRNALALRRRPRGVTRAERPCDVIRVGVARVDMLHRAVDAHLALQVRPHKHQAGGAARLE